MVYDYGRMRRIPFDPRMTKEIQRSPKMRAEQGAEWLRGWGGPSQYRTFAKLPMYQRLVYASVLEGATTQEEMEIRTGLSPQEISIGLTGLQKRGLVSIEKAPAEY